MFEIEIDVTARLSSGAKIVLTDDQQKQIKNSALAILLGKTTTPTTTKVDTKAAPQKRSRHKFYHQWKKEEEDLLVAFMFDYPDKKSRMSQKAQRDAKSLCQLLKISRVCLNSKIYEMRKTIKTKPRYVATGTVTAPVPIPKSSRPYFTGFSRPI